MYLERLEAAVDHSMVPVYSLHTSVVHVPFARGSCHNSVQCLGEREGQRHLAQQQQQQWRQQQRWARQHQRAHK